MWLASEPNFLGIFRDVTPLPFYPANQARLQRLVDCLGPAYGRTPKLDGYDTIRNYVNVTASRQKEK